MADLYSGNGAWPPAIEYLAQWVLHKPKELHSVTVFKKHLTRRFGSTVVAWRKAFGGGNQVSYGTFRRVCQEIGERHRCSEYFQELDPSRAGTISLFELDPDATVLLIKFCWRLIGVAGPEHMQDPEKLFARLTNKVRLNKPGVLEAHEFRKVAKGLGFDKAESDKVFQYLDSHGGDAHVPPATLLPSDLFWIKKIEQIVGLECVMLRDAAVVSEKDSMWQMTSSARVHNADGRRARTPAALVHRASQRLTITGISRPSMFARRSIADAQSINDKRRSSFSNGRRSNEGSPAPSCREIFSPPQREQARSQPTSPVAAHAGGTSSGGEEEETTKAFKALKAGDEITIVSPFQSDSPQRATLKRGQEGKIVRRESSGALMVEFPGIAGLQRVSVASALKVTKNKSGNMVSEQNSQRSTQLDSSAPVSQTGSEKGTEAQRNASSEEEKLEQLWADSDSEEEGDQAESSLDGTGKREESEETRDMPASPEGAAEEDASGYGSDTF
mmetsp:Transcript_44807/g.112655  ORF Transcript_44807/g.112655 Transcript_44807/m.112655 type:complete len:501 (+) Transcript_44807:214-1716(+)